MYRKQWYKSVLIFNEKNIFENGSLVVVKMNNDTKKVVNMKIFLNTFVFIYLHNPHFLKKIPQIWCKAI